MHFLDNKIKRKSTIGFAESFYVYKHLFLLYLPCVEEKNCPLKNKLLENYSLDTLSFQNCQSTSLIQA